MKIPHPGGGYIEPDEGPRNTRWHKRIVSAEPIPNTPRHWLVLECGHRYLSFGDLKKADGVILCTQCRDSDWKYHA